MNSVLLSQRHTDVLAEFVETLSCEHTLAIVLAGSAVNGTASRYSDLDLAHIVDAAYTGPEKKFYYRGPQLVSVTARTIGWWELAVERPERALFVVPAMRSARILFDPHGIFARYQANLASFSWASLQPAANEFVAATVSAQAETIHKILSALVRGEGMYEPTVMMTLDMTLVMAVRHGVLVEGSASYFRQVREAVGDNTAWSHWHRLATGQSNANEPAATSRQQAQAALHLYRETFRRIEPAMTADRRDFAGATVAVVDAALDMIS